MALYSYRAADQEGGVVEGSMEAKDEQAVVNRLQSLRLFPIKIEIPSAEQRASSSIALVNPFKRVKSGDLTTFTRELATLLNASFPLERCLNTLSGLSENPKLKEVVTGILEELRGGSSFSDCLGNYPYLFSDTYVNMVRAGETGGFLENVIERLAGYMENAQEVREQVISAMIYPLILISVGGGAVAILLTLVIPKFAQIFTEQGQTLPISTQIVMEVSLGIKSYWWLIIAISAALIIVIRAYKKTEQGALKYDGFMIRLPLLGKFFLLSETARLARTLGTLLDNGIPLYQSLLVLKDSMGNKVFARAIREAGEKLREGGGISDPLDKTEVFPPLFIQMISVGEETGNLEMMLFKAADTYEKQVQATVKRLTALMEPVMILLLGALVGFIVISMLLAIFSINDIPF